MDNNALKESSKLYQTKTCNISLDIHKLILKKSKRLSSIFNLNNLVYNLIMIIN